VQLTLRQLQIFRAIALTGGTTAAASSLPLSQSAISAALAELERGLQARLFDRVGKRLFLNDSGRTLLPLALGILDSARNIESVFSSSESLAQVNLHLFASTTIGNYVLPKLLSSFRASVPAAQLDVRIGNTLEVVNAVRDFATDLGLIEGPCHAADVIIKPWFEDELVIVAAPTHPLAKNGAGRKLTRAQLRQAPWLLREPGSGTREVVELILFPHLSNLKPIMTLGSSESIKNSAAEGLGVSCLSRSVVSDFVASHRLIVLETRLPRLVREFALIYHRNKTLSAGLRSFIQHCENWRLEPFHSAGSPGA
jgi:DNA-binding transcriptional LysR family regulator